MRKNENLFSIGEIVKALGITRRIILNYETKGLIVPDIKEGITGNRYYTIDTLMRIRTIRVLQSMGLMLDEIREYYNNSKDLMPILARMEKLRDELSYNITKIRERMNTLDSPKIEIMTIPQQTIYCRVQHCTMIEEVKNNLYEAMISAIREYGLDISKQLFFIEFNMKDCELISHCTVVPFCSKGEFIITLPEIQAIGMYHHGSYEKLIDSRDRLIKYAHENNIELKGTCRYIYIEGPPQHKDENKYITQIILPIL